MVKKIWIRLMVTVFLLRVLVPVVWPQERGFYLGNFGSDVMGQYDFKTLSPTTDIFGPLYKVLSLDLERCLKALEKVSITEIDKGTADIDEMARLVEIAYNAYGSSVEIDIKVDETASSNSVFPSQLEDCQDRLAEAVTAVAERYHEQSNFPEASKWFGNLLRVKLGNIAASDFNRQMWSISHIRKLQALAKGCCEKGQVEGSKIYHHAVVAMCESFLEEEGLTIDKLKPKLTSSWQFNLSFKGGESLFYLGKYNDAIAAFEAACLFAQEGVNENRSYSQDYDVEYDQDFIDRMFRLSIMKSLCYEKLGQKNAAGNSFKEALTWNWRDGSAGVSDMISWRKECLYREEDTRIIDGFIKNRDERLMRELKE